MNEKEALEKIASILDSVIVNFDQHLREDHKMKENKKTNQEKIIHIIIGVVIVTIGVAFAVDWYFSWLNATDYWDGFAPDGEYTVFISLNNHIDYANHKVFFPICEHSGGDLHGWWTFTDNTHFYPYPEDGSGYYGVQVEGGRIVIAWPK